ncbi:CvpA family protein [Croceicoccus sp. F390]|uniref:CvpA family protein n=1 Tax=Croceicoccus esteveae TaxID=3075597 RepID=A0ABU2ZGK7_9SPHN|nr:CvpA family protein [Croceicoccus sp. F390]MDT0575535.1 CvpA family protein [Croceicoccus sp. F390]
MTGFDLAVLIVVGFSAIGGIMRGFVHEVLTLCAWVAVVLAIYYLHTPLTAALLEQMDSQTSAAVLAFALLTIIPYGVTTLFARWAGSRSRASVLGPVDRLLGLGFGIIKGLIIVTLGFSLIVLVYDTIWGVEGRPDWMTQARSYAFVNAGGKALVDAIGNGRAVLLDAPAQDRSTEL